MAMVEGGERQAEARLTARATRLLAASSTEATSRKLEAVNSLG
jgi:hypothetical protein